MRGSVSVRDELVQALELDLVGPDVASAHATETLDRPPSRWYLTGFLVPRTASEALRKDDDAPDDLDAGVEVATDGGDAGDHETRAAQKRFFPASMGLSVLVPGDTRFLYITVTWGDYARDPERSLWKRTPCKAVVSVVPSGASVHPLHESRGLTLHVVDREVPSVDGRPLVAPGARALSLFVVNERTPDEEHPERRDETYAFQVRMQIDCDTCFIARPDLHGVESADLDERVADLQFRDVHEYAVGHGVAPVAAPHRSECTSVATTWVPSAWVHRVEAAGPAALGVDPDALVLDALAEASDPRAVQDRLAPMVDAWRAFIRRGAATQGLTPERAEVARALCEDARLACARLADGVARLADPEVFRCSPRPRRGVFTSTRSASPSTGGTCWSPRRTSARPRRR